MKTAEFILFSHWASYLINGDCSGLTDSEAAEVDAFMARPELKGFSCCGVSEDSWFARRNDGSSLGGEVSTFTFLAHE